MIGWLGNNGWRGMVGWLCSNGWRGMVGWLGSNGWRGMIGWLGSNGRLLAARSILPQTWVLVPLSTSRFPEMYPCLLGYDRLVRCIVSFDSLGYDRLVR